MANSNTPFGFKPVSVNGIEQDARVTWYSLYGTNQAMAIGDLVALRSDGTVDRWDAGNTGAQTVATRGPILGVVAGFKPAGGAGYPNEASTSVNRERTYASASLTGTWLVGVYDDPSQEFECQVGNDATPTGIQQTHIGNIADVYVTAPVQFSTCTGRSKMELDFATVAAGAGGTGYALRIKRFRNMIGDSTGSGTAGQYAKVIVSISSHFNRGQASSSGQTPGV